MLRLFILFFIISFLFTAPAPAAETTTVGTTCTAGAHRADWDTIFQCSGGTWKRAPYFFGASSDSCDATHAGIIQWTGSVLQYCSGSSWQPFSASLLGASAASTSPNRSGEISTGLFSAASGSVSIATLGTERLVANSAGNIGLGMAPSYRLDISGVARASGEVISTSANTFRMVQGNYGTFWRNDGSNTYLLLTASGDPYGSWNSLRPLTINDASGDVSVGPNLSVGGNIYWGTGGNWLSAYLNQAVRTDSSPTFNNIYLTYLGDWLSNRVNQAVTTSSQPNFWNIYVGYLGWLSDILNQAVRTDSSPTFANIYLSYLGDWLSNRLDQAVKTNSRPTFGGLTVNGHLHVTAPVGGTDAVWGYQTGSSYAAVVGIAGSTAGAHAGYFQVTGGTTCALNGTATSWYCYSDKRLKKNIVKITGALDKIMTVDGVYFQWNKQKGTERQTGVIAQNVRKAFPEVVKLSKKDGYYSVEYTGLIPPLIEAVKELKIENDRLRSEINAKDAAFAARLEALEARNK